MNISSHKNNNIWQFQNYSLRTKLVIAFIVIAIGSVGSVSFMVDRSLRASQTDQIGNNMSVLAQTEAFQTGQILENDFNLLNSLAIYKAVRDRADLGTQLDTLTQDQIKQLDQQWQAADAANNNNDPLVAKVLNDDLSGEFKKFQSKFPEHVEIFLTDLQGVSIASSDRTSDYLQSDESWWQTAYKEGQYIGQPEFDASTKTIAINMAVPVRARGSQQIVGILRTTVNINSLSYALNIGRFGNSGVTDIYLPDGQVIKLVSSGIGNTVVMGKTAALNNNIFNQPSKKYLELSMAGIPSLLSTAVVTVTDDASQNNIITNLGWRVVVHQDQAEALKPVETQTRNDLLLAVLVTVLAAVAALGLAQLLAGPIIRLNAVAEKVAAGDLSVQAKVETSDETGTLAATFNKMVAQLSGLIGSLEQRVADRTQSLVLAADVGRSVSQVRALDIMLKDAAELIRSQFDLYYAQVYLVDANQTNLILQSGTGAVGAELISRHHSLPLNSGSINGRAATEKRSLVVSDTTASTTFRPNPLLPDTRSEMAVPLLIGEKVVGVLDLQSIHGGALNQDNLSAFEALAGQLAIAIQNANLLAEAEQARTELEKQAARQSHTNWKDYLDAIHRPEHIGYTYDQNQVVPIAEVESLPFEADNTTLTAPISVTGESLGTLTVELDEEKRNEQALELVNTVARQVAQKVESLRLLDSAERYRFEAEQASRRLTHEGWKSYLDTKSGESLSYFYDLKDVKPYDQKNNNEAECPAFTLPLKVRDETVGEFSIQEFDSDDKASIEFVNSVAERLGTHIEGLRLSEQIEKRAYELATIASVSTTASSTLDPAKLLQSVVDLTKESFGFYHAHIYLLNEAGNSLELTAGAGDVGKQMVAEGHSIPLDTDRSLVARSARSRVGFFVNDTRSESDFLPNPLLPNTRSELAVPMLVGDKVIGVFDVQANTTDRFAEDDIRIQTTLASQISVAVQNARTFAQAQRQAEREATLNVISQKIQGATTVEAALQIAARELGHALGAPLTIAQLGIKDRNNGGNN